MQTTKCLKKPGANSDYIKKTLHTSGLSVIYLHSNHNPLYFVYEKRNRETNQIQALLWHQLIITINGRAPHCSIILSFSEVTLRWSPITAALQLIQCFLK